MPGKNKLGQTCSLQLEKKRRTLCCYHGEKGRMLFSLSLELSHLKLGPNHQGVEEGIVLVECLHLVVHFVVMVLAAMVVVVSSVVAVVVWAVLLVVVTMVVTLLLLV